MKQEIPWSRFAVEAIVIVGSILLAFVIDAWWEERQERIAEREELARLLSEFESIKDQIGEVRSQALTTSVTVVNRILEESVQLGLETATLTNIDLARTVGKGTLELDTPVFDSLVNSGRLEIIESVNILKTIGDWDRWYKNAQEAAIDSRRFVMNQLIPAVAANNNIQHILVNQFAALALNDLEPSETTEIKTDPLLISMMAERYFWVRMVDRSWSIAREEAETVILEISSFLDES